MNAHAKTGTKFMFIVALGAMGLKTDFSKLKQAGIKPLFLGAMSWAYVSLTGLLLAAFFLSGGLDKIRNFMTLLLNQWFE